MGITSIIRDTGDNVAIVRVVTTDTTSAALAANYITAQASNISLANSGAFTWLANDSILLSASDGNTFASINGTFTSLSGYVSSPNSVIVSLSNAQLLGMYGAPISVLAAPSAGQLIVVRQARLEIIYGTAQFAAGGVIALQYKNTINGGGTAASGTIAAATLNALTANTVLQVVGATSIALLNATAQGLWLSNATGAFTTGDSTGKLFVNYDVIAV